jgi:hypothetical protein
MKITFSMDQDTAVALINLLGQLPTNSGVFPVLTMMVAQFKDQTEEKQDGAEPVAA